MPTVTLEYYGMEGTGRTLAEAKRDAGRKIEKALSGTYTPSILTHRGYSVLVWRDPAGWCTRLIADPVGHADRSGRQYAHPNYETEEDATTAAYAHLAQLGWTSADGLEAPEFLRDRTARRDFAAWARFQIRFEAARAHGLDHNDAHSWAGRDPARPDLQELPITATV